MPNFLRKRILVTGGAGFLGSHLCEPRRAATLCRRAASGCHLVTRVGMGMPTYGSGIAAYGTNPWLPNCLDQPPAPMMSLHPAFTA